MKLYAIAAAALALLITGCSQIEVRYQNGPKGLVAKSRNRDLANGYAAGYNPETGSFYLNTCGGAVTRASSPFEEAGAQALSGVVQLGLGLASAKTGIAPGGAISPQALQSPLPPGTCTREDHIRAIISDPSIATEALARMQAGGP